MFNVHFIHFFAVLHRIPRLVFLHHLVFFKILVAHPGARTWCHALPWWALRCGYPHGLPAALTKNTLIMIMRSHR